MLAPVVFPNSFEAEGLPPAEVENRVNSYNRRRAQLKSNPNLFVSRTRLSVRRLPLFITEHALRKTAIWAVREFEDQVKSGGRQDLTEEEQRGSNEGVEDGVDSAKKIGKNRRIKGRQIVKQAKIVKQSDRVDALTGDGRSTGYGFLELWSHADALKFLRFTNHNPQVSSYFKTFWKTEVTEMVHNVEKELKKLEDLGKKPSRLSDEQVERKGELESRLKRLKDEEANMKESTKDEGKDKIDKKTPIVEFAIENMLIMKKREARATEKTTSESRTRRAKAPVGDGEGVIEEKPRHANWNMKTTRSADRNLERQKLTTPHVGEK